MLDAWSLLQNNFSQFWSKPIRSFLQLQMELSSYKLINLDGTIFGIKKIETNLNPFQHKCLDRLDQMGISIFICGI